MLLNHVPSKEAESVHSRKGLRLKHSSRISTAPRKETGNIVLMEFWEAQVSHSSDQQQRNLSDPVTTRNPPVSIHGVLQGGRNGVSIMSTKMIIGSTKGFTLWETPGFSVGYMQR